MPSAIPSSAALLEIEKQLDCRKYRYVVGVDEVGRGSWAGPMYVGAVAYQLQSLLNTLLRSPDERVPESFSESSRRDEYLKVDDSKKLSARVRESLVGPIKALACGCGIGIVEPTELDSLGMTSGFRLGLDRALVQMNEFVSCGIVLIDGVVGFHREGQSLAIPKGDTKSFAIASASIIAKVDRDSRMTVESESYPWYGFEKNKGYPSPVHVSALYALGPSPIHRKSWSYISRLPWRKP